MKQIKPQKPFKQPVSVLVIIYSLDGKVLLLERADHPDFWQSVTGSQESGESLIDTARREVFEETGLKGNILDWNISNTYEIYALWRHRYAPNTRYNTEHVFGLQLNASCDVKLAPGEHLQYMWLPWEHAAKKVFSPSNAEGILILGQRFLR